MSGFDFMNAGAADEAAKAPAPAAFDFMGGAPAPAAGDTSAPIAFDFLRPPLDDPLD